MSNRSPKDKIISISLLSLVAISIPPIVMMYLWALITAGGVDYKVPEAESQDVLIKLLVGAIGSILSMAITITFVVIAMKKGKSSSWISFLGTLVYGLFSIGLLAAINFFG